MIRGNIKETMAFLDNLKHKVINLWHGWVSKLQGCGVPASSEYWRVWVGKQQSPHVHRTQGRGTVNPDLPRASHPSPTSVTNGLCKAGEGGLGERTARAWAMAGLFLSALGEGGVPGGCWHLE